MIIRVDEVLMKDPSQASEPAMLQLRSFCQHFSKELGDMMERPEVEQKLYDSPPQAFK